MLVRIPGSLSVTVIQKMGHSSRIYEYLSKLRIEITFLKKSKEKTNRKTDKSIAIESGEIILQTLEIVIRK